MATPDFQMRDASSATFAALTERELANILRNEGARIIQRGNRYWQQSGAPGFFQPVHHMARLTAEEAASPTPLSWGYRTTLAPESSGAANGMLPIVRLPDLESYDVGSLSANRRNKLRKCQRLVKIVQLTGPKLLLEQGYEVLVDALSRTRYQKIPSRERYVSDVKKYFQGNHWCVLAGLIDGKLGGYVDSYVVDGVAYGRNAYYATWALPTNISTGLVFEFAQICRRLKLARIFVNGLHTPESPQLNQFKEDMGFTVEHIPTKWDMNVLARTLIRRHRPHAFYRLTGLK